MHQVVRQVYLLFGPDLNVMRLGQQRGSSKYSETISTVKE